MTNKELHSVVTINNEDYDIVAKKVSQGLTIKVGDSEAVTFDGSEAKTINVAASGSVVAGATYLGTVSGTTGLSSTAKAGDFYRVATAFVFGSETAHVGDILIASTDAPEQNPTGWDILHTESIATFSQIEVNSQNTKTNLFADSAAGKLTLTAGTNITLTSSANDDSIIIAATGTGGNFTETPIIVVNKTTIDANNVDTDDTVYAVTNIEESLATSATKGHTITPTYKAVPTKAYVDNMISHGTEDPSDSVTSQYYFKY